MTKVPFYFSFVLPPHVRSARGDGRASHIIIFAGRKGENVEKSPCTYRFALLAGEEDLILAFYISKIQHEFGQVCLESALGEGERLGCWREQQGDARRLC